MKFQEEDVKISVIMSVFNAERCVSRAIESIMKQTFKNFELIIIEDGSNDNTLDILKNYAKNDKRIKLVINKTNIGLTKSLNKGIKLSKGEFIARHDVDDVSLPFRLEKQLDFMTNNPEFAFCGSNIFIQQNQKYDIKIFEIDEIRKKLIIKNCFTHSTIFIRKGVLNLYGFFNEKYLYGQDYELWCRLIFRYNLKAKNLKNKLVIMNIPNERLSQKSIKFIIQNKNYIKTKLEYLKYSQSFTIIVICMISILKSVLEIIYVFLLNICFSKFYCFFYNRLIKFFIMRIKFF